jgi:hypothetical protein
MMDLISSSVLRGGDLMANKGKGWFGDTEGHRKAGRKGGLARSRKNRGNDSR